MAKQHSTLLVDGAEIRFYQEQTEDFISLTDIARRFNERTDQLILTVNGWTSETGSVQKRMIQFAPDFSRGN